MLYKTGITREIGGYDTEHKSTMGGKTTSPEDMRYEGIDKEEDRGERRGTYLDSSDIRDLNRRRARGWRFVKVSCLFESGVILVTQFLWS